MSPAGVVARLNAVRAANGFPAGLVEDPALSAGCALHNRYQHLNGEGHGEDPAAPGYTPAGAAAGARSELADAPWDEGADPWASAPYHLVGLLQPGLQRVGADDVVLDGQAYSCLDVGDGVVAPRVAPVDRVYAYPGPGRAGVAPAEVARELPGTPGDRVGLPEGTETGPHLIVWPDGPSFAAPGSVRLVEGSLRGPDGEVDVRWVPDPAWGAVIGAPSAPLRERYPALDTDAAKVLAKSLAKRVDGARSDDPLLRELHDEVETLRRTLYSPTPKRSWIGDSLKTIRALLEEAATHEVGQAIRAHEFIAQVERILQP